MRRKKVSGIMILLMLVGMLSLAFDMQPVKADWTWTETIYIRADGSIEPSTAPISTVDNATYTFTDNIVGDVPENSSAIVVERDNIVVDGADRTLQGIETYDSAGIYLLGRSNVSIRNVNIKSYDWGIYLNGSSNNNIANNDITNTNLGIRLFGSSNNTLTGNDITNTNCGIYLYWSSNNTIMNNKLTESNGGIYFYQSPNNTIMNNKLRANNSIGIVLMDSSNNNIFGNDIALSREGIYLYASLDNFLYHNNFENNTYPVIIVIGYANSWDNGFPSGGNYWSDYAGVDEDRDGIGDTPHVIDADNEDRYPLMEPWSPPTMIRTLIRTVRFWNPHNGAENSLTSKLGGALRHLDKGKENKATHKLMTFINHVEVLREKRLANDQADYLISEAQRIIDLING